MFNLFPYTNTHELNFDWILKTIKEFVATMENIDNVIDEHIATVDIAGMVRDVVAGNIGVINVKTFGAKGDAGTDDTLAIQSAVNVAANGGIVYIPKGTFIVSNINVPSNTHLIIDGVVMLKNGANNHVITIANGCHDIIIEGRGSLNGNKAGQYINTLACIYGSFDGATCDTYNIKISGLNIYGSKNWGINLSAKNSIIEKCIIHDNTNMSFFGPKSENVVIDGCITYNVSPDWGIGFYGGVVNGTMTRCIAYNCALAALGVLADVAQPTGSKNILISNCIAFNSTIGIGVQGPHDGVVVSNCLSYDNTSGAPTESGGINIGGSKNVLVTGNICTKNVFASVVIQSTVSDVDIRDNRFINGVGVFFTFANANHVYICDNVFDDTQAVVTTNSFVNLAGTSVASEVYITNNTFGRNVPGQDKIYLGVPATVIRGNTGYNHYSVGVTPLLPASGVETTNTTGRDVFVSITGGNVIQVFLNADLLNATTGLIPLTVGDKIKVVYTDAPTWSWIGM